jgi:hypothetical protein
VVAEAGDRRDARSGVGAARGGAGVPAPAILDLPPTAPPKKGEDGERLN